MVEFEINISVQDEFTAYINEDWLKNVALEVLNTEIITIPIEMGLVVASAETVQQLNLTYRGKDEPTDVLSFSFSEPEDSNKLFVPPPDGVCHLGEVVISFPHVVQQANKPGCHVEQELASLVVHGVLHLLGYNHEQLEEKQRMRAKERQVLKKVKYTM